MTPLEEFCFYAICRPPITPEMVREEWRLQTKGTEYEGIPLYVGSASE